jgi:hypothetical protein
LMLEPSALPAVAADLERLGLAHWRIGEVVAAASGHGAPRDGERLRFL